ncbi:TPA: hypothetical protein ACS72K_001797 [Providencia alcalifaciens]
MNNEVNRQGSVALTWTDTSKALKILILTKRPELMYEYFASKGDRYALLTNSVVKGDSFSGKFALNYRDHMSSINHSSSSFDRDFRVPQAPSMPEFNYSGGYSSPSSRFSF